MQDGSGTKGSEAPEALETLEAPGVGSEISRRGLLADAGRLGGIGTKEFGVLGRLAAALLGRLALGEGVAVGDGCSLCRKSSRSISRIP